MQWTGNELANNCHGKIICGDPETTITGFAIDSRQVKPGDLFICLKGNQTDGHKFVQQALENGAKGLLVHQDITGEKVCQENQILTIWVKDTLQALQSLGRKHRQKFAVSVVAITGSIGKTTTKDMVAKVLETKYNVLKTRGNLNSEISLPLMLLELNRNHQVAVLEMGMNQKGEIALLAEMARPNVGVITRIAESHIEKLGSMEKIMEAKGELLENLLRGSTAVLNYDDERVVSMRSKAPGRVVFYGLGGGDITAHTVTSQAEGIKAKLSNGNKTVNFEMPVLGVHNLSNALAAVAVGQVFGIHLEAAAHALKKIEISKMRGQIYKHKGFIVIDDSYNANVQSTKAALNILAHYGNKRKIAVLGDMYELGHYSEEAHREIGNAVIDMDIDIMITVGNLSKTTYKHVCHKGGKHVNLYHVSTNQEAIQLLNSLVRAEDVILVKGSRGMAMEHIVESMRQL